MGVRRPAPAGGSYPSTPGRGRGSVSRPVLLGVAAVSLGAAAFAALAREGPDARAAGHDARADGHDTGAPAPDIRSPGRAGGLLAAAPADSSFAGLIARLSGEGAYFDTDNLISNETSYLHVAARLRALRAPGLGYIGVGPDQNFSYIAALRPEISFILDIRRDNLLQHLLLKAVMEASPDRASYLAALFGRPAPPDSLREDGADLAAILDWVAATPAPASPGEEAAWPGLPPGLESRIAGFGLDLPPAETAAIARFHREFVQAGPGLRFRSHGRAPRWYYPTYRELLLERDERGRLASYLASEADYRFVRALQERDLIVPVVGDFAGPHALRAIGEELRRRGLAVGAFYTSNVEFYLYEQRAFERYAASVATLPAAPGAVLVRSYFHRGRPHADTRPGYASTQLLQPLGAFVEGAAAGAFGSYPALIYGPAPRARRDGTGSPR